MSICISVWEKLGRFKWSRQLDRDICIYHETQYMYTNINRWNRIPDPTADGADSDRRDRVPL